jgi:prepilin-type N-terminal cleavage/methylation domain-containing protein
VRHRRSSGFTLIELMVVTGIIVVVTGVVLANNNRFGGVVLLENLTYDVALSVRQAQVYGISVSRFGASNFGAGYGVDFNKSSPTTYTLFGDSSGNGLYDCTTPGSLNCELISATNINSGYYVASLCATPAGGSETCSGISSIDIVFKRPEPDAWISINGISCISDTSACQESARITLESPRGDLMSVDVAANGQISVGK